MRRLTRIFAARRMLLIWNHVSVGFPEVTVTVRAARSCGNLLPELLTSGKACGRQYSRPRLGELHDTGQSRPSVCGSFSGRMTRVHPTPRRSLPDRAGLAQPAWSVTPVTSGTFFEPTADRIARHAEGARQAAQGTALVIGAKYSLTLLRRVAIRLRVVTAAASAV